MNLMPKMEWKENIMMDEEELAYTSDSKFKQFGTAVDKTLKSFEYSTEWADLISCLGKLNKVILAYASFPVIPRKLLVGKRLAQCLHPALPSGVHLKALETYRLIFKQIGHSRVTKDLFIYSAGLFPLLSAAAISVKPILLSLYEEFYVPLGTHLIPGLPGFLMAVLPGIEEGSEFNERTTSLLEAVCQNTQRASFFSSLWGCVLHSSHVRLPAITFLLNHLSKHSDESDRSYIFGNDVSLMIDAICLSLEDQNVLVQRIMLDFLLLFIPLENDLLKKSDTVNILVCALSVVLRRDMSLNRRLYQWIMGRTDDNIAEDTTKQGGSSVPQEKLKISHFEMSTKTYVVTAVISLFKSVSSEACSLIQIKAKGTKMDIMKPFRILISLLDKPEIGSVILEDVLLEVLRTLYYECTTPKDGRGEKENQSVRNELIKTANLLFNSFESYFIWEYLGRSLIDSFQVCQDSAMVLQNNGILEQFMLHIPPPSCSELFSIIDFLLDAVSIEATVETQTEHWPCLLNCLVDQMEGNLGSMVIEDVYQGMLLALKLLSKISPDMNSPLLSRKVKEAEDERCASISTVLKRQNETAQTDDNEVNVILLCVRKSTKFFHSFVKQWVLPFPSLSKKDSEAEKDENKVWSESKGAVKSGIVYQTTLAASFAATCRYLVELACFPCWKQFSIEKNTDENGLSDWLQSLIACISETNDINIQTIAMGSLLDLVNVSLCVLQSCDKNKHVKNTANVISLISGADFLILDRSDVYKDMALILWNEFCPENCQILPVCADLFLRLHNISPHTVLCEEVISNTMVSQALEIRRAAHWKFSVLWHLSREFYKNESSKSSRGGNRNLDRCMMLMLDSLQSLDPVVAKCSEQWLKHAIHSGDIGRLLEPLLITMLNPCSRRISVHYASLNTPITSENDTCALSQDLLSDTEGDQIYQGSEALEGDSNELLHVKKMTVESHDSLCVANVKGFKNGDDIRPKQNDEDLRERSNLDLSNDLKEGSEQSIRSTQEITPSKHDGKISRKKSVHPLHVHKLYYTQLYDTTQTIYALKTILAILEVDGKAFVFSSATTSMSMSNTAHQTGLRELLIRHRRALIGKDFYGSLADSQQLLIKASTAKYMEILLSICLYFIRSEYHPNLNCKVSDLEENFRVRVWSLQLLTKVVSVLLELVTEGDNAFSNFVSDLFDRCKVQRIALHCLLSSVYSLSSEKEELQTNDNIKEKLDLRINGDTKDSTRSEMHRHFLNLVKKLVFLEERMGYGKSGLNDKKTKRMGKEKKMKSQKLSSQFEFIIGSPIVLQPMFLSVLLSALKEERWSHSHIEWINIVLEILPKTGNAMPKIVVPVVDQIFLNLKRTTGFYFQAISGELNIGKEGLPIDYLLTCVENVTKICHYCLVEKEIICGIVKSSNDDQSNEQSSSIFESLAHVFSSQAVSNRAAAAEEVNEPWLETKEGLLSILPAILSSLLMTWHVWNQTSRLGNRWKMAKQSPLPIGQPKSVRQAILQFLTPLAMQHTPVFLAAIADVWNSSKQMHKEVELEKSQSSDEKMADEKVWLTSMNEKSVPVMNALHESLLDIVLAIKVLPTDKIVDTCKDILRQTLGGKERISSSNQSLELNLLQFVYEYLKKIAKDQLLSIKPVLLGFLKDGINFNSSPQTLFVLLNIFYSFVFHTQCPDDKRSRKELQDLAVKFFEAMNTIAGASLESSTWFRRNVAVLPSQSETSESTNGMLMTSTTTSVHLRNSQYSANALCLMAEVLPSMLDLLHLSEEKDRITSFLFYVMYNVTPYLKNHSVQNVTNFRASSALLASLTDYQYTLRSWKKDVFDLFLENEFFKMDFISLRFWRCIIDHLMTYDVATFRDLMARISMTQSGAINIFSNREQEIEQRANLLKRLTFIIFCGETDQYHNYMPDIQEKLVDSLRQMQAPLLYQQVFFCFRVLILRMSPNHLTSLWPHVITELITVFLRMEKELITTDTQQPIGSIVGTIESFFTFNSCSKNKDRWLQLYLEACKLLDLSFSLESDDVPHVQSYRWAFVDTPGVEYDYVEGFKETDVDISKCSTNADKLRGSMNDNNEKHHSKGVSKLSVMNAPLTSKLRQTERKFPKEKTKAEKKSKLPCQMNFVPYLLRLKILLSRKISLKETVGSKKASDSALNEECTETKFYHKEETSYTDSSIKVSGDGAADEKYNKKAIYHALEITKIESVLDLLPFFESLLNKTEIYEKTQIKRAGKLEDCTERDFQEELIARVK